MSKEECRRFEKKLAFHTAPSLLGIKCASLFTLSRSEFDIGGNARRFNRRAAARGLKIKVLREECSCAGRSLILVYSPKLLAARLSAPENRELLREYGYTDDMPLDECLERLSERTKCDDFPHEIGIFLGYPAEDVRGFVENGGCNYKLCGCWKRGERPPEVRSLRPMQGIPLRQAGAGRGPLSGAEDIIRRTTTMKIAVIYWSGTGNTEAMASAVAEGAGAELYSVSQFSGDVSEYDRLAFGCPAMGAENLEEGEFEPFFEGIESKLSGKKVALFGSYGWGDGEWMREWAERVRNDGAALVNDEGLIANETPDDAALADCKALGAKLAE